MRQQLVALLAGLLTLAIAQAASANGTPECPEASTALTAFNVSNECEPPPPPPPPSNPGTGTPGYWKNHPNDWPVMELKLGNTTYGKTALLAILRTPTRGDGTYTMARALIAALLNGLIDNDTSCIDAVVDDAQAWLTQHPIGSGVRGGSHAWLLGSAIAGTLDDYNNGLLCAPHRN